jgi:hypothetical protein
MPSSRSYSGKCKICYKNYAVLVCRTKSTNTCTAMATRWRTVRIFVIATIRVGLEMGARLFSHSLLSLFPRFVCLLVCWFSIGQRGHGRPTIVVYDQCRQSPGAMGHGRIMIDSFYYCLCAAVGQVSGWWSIHSCIARNVRRADVKANERKTKWTIRYRRDYCRTSTH